MDAYRRLCTIVLRPPARCPLLALHERRPRGRPSRIAHSHPLNRRSKPMLIAPTSSPIASPRPSALVLEDVVGEITAGAAVALAQALRESQTDGLSVEVKMRVGDLIARLFALRLYTAGQMERRRHPRAAGTLRQGHQRENDRRVGRRRARDFAAQRSRGNELMRTLPGWTCRPVRTTERPAAPVRPNAHRA